MQKLRKHQFDALLITLSLVCATLMLIASNDPVLPLLEGTVAHSALKQFTTGNQIVFDLSVGVLGGVFIYYLVVRVPDHQKRRRLRSNLAATYTAFKEDSIRVYLSCFMTSYSADLPQQLLDQSEFRRFFEEQYGTGMNRWHAVANGLTDHRLRTLVVELEILMHEIHFTLTATDVQDQHAFQFFKRLSRILYRSKNWTTDYDDVKSLMGFLWALHTGWSWVNGYRKSDPVRGVSEFLCVRRSETCPRRRSSLATNDRRGGQVGGRIVTRLFS